jgi:hypothetical protein
MRALYIDGVSHREDADSIRSVTNLAKLADTESGGTKGWHAKVPRLMIVASKPAVEI